MSILNDNNVEVANRFGDLAQRFCAVVDSAPSLGRTDLVLQLYRILPRLIGEAISFPNVELKDDADSAETDKSRVSVARLNHERWGQLCTLLREKLGDWDSYWQVFNPTKDNEAIHVSLANDIADIYRDLNEGLVLNETHQAPPENIIWQWRLGFDSHWGKHAIDALRTMHFLLGPY